MHSGCMFTILIDNADVCRLFARCGAVRLVAVHVEEAPALQEIGDIGCGSSTGGGSANSDVRVRVVRRSTTGGHQQIH
jgi:hypothetical protein